MTDGVFDFKIREELRKMTEFKDLTIRWSLWTRKDVPVTLDMLIDIITYYSKGDLDLAIRGLRSSEQFLARSAGRDVYTEARDLLVEVWRSAFISTRCYFISFKGKYEIIAIVNTSNQSINKAKVTSHNM